MTLKEQIIETFKIQAYCDNILDAFYKIEDKSLASFFEKTYKSCKNFKNRLSSKSNSKPDKLLLDILSKEEVKDFEGYRDSLAKAMDFCLNIHPYDYTKLDKIIDASIEENMVFIDQKNLRRLLVDFRLSTLSVDKYLIEKKLK